MSIRYTHNHKTGELTREVYVDCTTSPKPRRLPHGALLRNIDCIKRPRGFREASREPSTYLDESVVGKCPHCNREFGRADVYQAFGGDRRVDEQTDEDDYQLGRTDARDRSDDALDDDQDEEEIVGKRTDVDASRKTRNSQTFRGGKRREALRN